MCVVKIFENFYDFFENIHAFYEPIDVPLSPTYRFGYSDLLVLYQTPIFADFYAINDAFMVILSGKCY